MQLSSCLVSLTQLVNLTSEYYEPERYIRRHQITIRWDLCDKIRRPQYGANSLALRPPINKRSSEPLRHIISDDLTPNFLYKPPSNLRNPPRRLTHSAGTTLSTPAPVASYWTCCSSATTSKSRPRTDYTSTAVSLMDFLYKGHYIS